VTLIVIDVVTDGETLEDVVIETEPLALGDIGGLGLPDMVILGD